MRKLIPVAAPTAVLVAAAPAAAHVFHFPLSVRVPDGATGSEHPAPRLTLPATE